MSSPLQRLGRFAGFPLLISAGLLAQDWKTAKLLPGVDFNGLSAVQKTKVLKVLRDTGCSCGCGMKLAECRIADPGCAYSTNLAAVAIEAVKAGKSEADTVAAIHSSQWSHVEPQKVLGDPVKIPVAGAPALGPANAPITVVEFSDFQCPYCVLAVAQIQALLKAYPFQVRLIFKQFPLETHPQADLAAAASLAAHKQNKFWVLHDAMFAHRDDLSRKSIVALAKQGGLDIDRFETDIDSTEVREAVVRDVRDGNRAGVEGTPTIFINGQHFNGPIEINSLRPVIDSELKAKLANQTAKR